MRDKDQLKQRVGANQARTSRCQKTKNLMAMEDISMIIVRIAAIIIPTSKVVAVAKTISNESLKEMNKLSMTESFVNPYNDTITKKRVSSSNMWANVANSSRTNVPQIPAKTTKKSMRHMKKWTMVNSSSKLSSPTPVHTSSSTKNFPPTKNTKWRQMLNSSNTAKLKRKR